MRTSGSPADKRRPFATTVSCEWATVLKLLRVPDRRSRVSPRACKIKRTFSRSRVRGTPATRRSTPTTARLGGSRTSGVGGASVVSSVRPHASIEKTRPAEINSSDLIGRGRPPAPVHAGDQSRYGAAPAARRVDVLGRVRCAAAAAPSSSRSGDEIDRSLIQRRHDEQRRSCGQQQLQGEECRRRGHGERPAPETTGVEGVPLHRIRRLQHDLLAVRTPRPPRPVRALLPRRVQYTGPELTAVLRAANIRARDRSSVTAGESFLASTTSANTP